MKNRDANIVVVVLIAVLFLLIVPRIVERQREPSVAAEPNTKATNTSDYGIFDEHGTGAMTSYVHNRVAITSISVENAEVENPNKEAREILETVKKVIKEKGNKITYVELISEKIHNGVTIQQYVIIFEPNDPNSPP